MTLTVVERAEMEKHPTQRLWNSPRHSGSDWLNIAFQCSPEGAATILT